MGQQAGTTRLTVDVDQELFEWVALQRAQDRIKTTKRLRALLALSREDNELQARVVRKAAELDQQERATSQQAS